MDPKHTQTRILLEKTHSGDTKARDQLLEENLPWIRAHIKKRLGAGIRSKEETIDLVQDAARKFLDYGPKFVVSEEDQFRGLMVRIIENMLRDKHDWFRAQKRDMAKEREIGRDSVLHLDRPQGATPDRPSQILQKKEEEDWLHLALRLLEPEDQEVLHLRQWEGLSFAEVGEQLGVPENTARMRFNRALPKLAKTLEKLRNGGLDGLV